MVERKKDDLKFGGRQAVFCVLTYMYYTYKRVDTCEKGGEELARESAFHVALEDRPRRVYWSRIENAFGNHCTYTVTNIIIYYYY